KKIFSYVYKYLRQNKKRYMGLAIFCKVLLFGFLAIPILQTIQTAYAQSTCGNAIIERGENCDDGNTNNND
ncbi:hypothetical protein KKG31_07210, partial [Patescibacteria group bacterium]|nr:hypothetical protein [Patescibacteria group bacterium]